MGGGGKFGDGPDESPNILLNRLGTFGPGEMPAVRTRPEESDRSVLGEGAWIYSPDVFGEMSRGGVIGTMHEDRGRIMIDGYIWMSSESPGDPQGCPAAAGEAVDDQVLHD